MKLVTVSLLGTAAALAASGAMAADVLPPVISPVVAAAPPSSGCTVAGYVDAFGAVGWGNEWQYDLPEYETVWRELGFGGAGRAAIQCKPRFSIQLDAWAEHWEGVEQEIDYGDPIGPPEYFSSTTMGIGTHLTFHAGNFAVGTLLSVGAVADWGTFGTAALEAAFNAPKFRVQGQAGATFALLGDAASYDALDYYAQIVAAFYPKPNVSFSATFGGDIYSDNDPWFGWTVNWGGRIEFQPMQKHFSIYVAYQGWYWRDGPGVDPDLYAGIEHVVGIGIRFLAGAPTVRAMDEQVGLADYNATYGLTFPR
jgi:hypothetical protein